MVITSPIYRTRTYNPLRTVGVHFSGTDQGAEGGHHNNHSKNHNLHQDHHKTISISTTTQHKHDDDDNGPRYLYCHHSQILLGASVLYSL